MKRLLFAFVILSLSLSGFGQYSKVVAIGDSLTAGFMSGGLVETNQLNSYPALVARQLGISPFELPLISEPGLPALLELHGLLSETGQLSPTIEAITDDPTEWGVPLNLTLARPYDNLGVPGATLNNCLNTITDEGGMHDLILRGLGTQVQQALSLQPDLLLVWIGNNDALGAALMGTAIPGVTLTPKDVFAAQYADLMDTLTAGSSADIVAGNIPDVTTLPFVTTVPPYLVNPSTGEAVIGPDGSPMTFLGQNDGGGIFITPDTFVLLTALDYIKMGYGIPATLGGTGIPLPAEVVLTPAETATIQEYVADFNNSIQAVASSHGIPVYDFAALLELALHHGIEIAGMTFNTEFLTGGLFSYDGFHLTGLGYALAANAFIEAINDGYGHAIEPVPLSDYFFPPCCPHARSNSFDVEVHDLRASILIMTQHCKNIKQYRELQ
ncbi:MAG TPA: SGNH/GDSL hydrolase family protein [Thermoanaerobaculia bacterium]|nr:SGNH/GDSL hydrolase family protein [Thermoanaerobaculia bacterium]HUM29356.1 SGNH/GDSL hydrolase family protein [Thermoanaerobaculia bacterium]HXK67602.1 SGNH/GDSL hydrolase family protein [Thermoanaerobaculia bacterium]